MIELFQFRAKPLQFISANRAAECAAKGASSRCDLTREPVGIPEIDRIRELAAENGQLDVFCRFTADVNKWATGGPLAGGPLTFGHALFGSHANALAGGLRTLTLCSHHRSWSRTTRATARFPHQPCTSRALPRTLLTLKSTLLYPSGLAALCELPEICWPPGHLTFFLP
jgi:hypothetical protein